jgi:anti-anti-sigma factor
MTLIEPARPSVRVRRLAVSVSADGAATVVRLHGEVDVANLPVVVNMLTRVIADHDGPIIVDLADTAFIDAGTVHALTRASHILDDRGRTLTLRSPSRAARRLLALLELSHLVEADETVLP